MSTLIESLSVALLLFLLVLLFSHMLNGTANTWIMSKIKAGPVVQTPVVNAATGFTTGTTAAVA